MKITQFHGLIEAAAQMHRGAGNAAAADALDAVTRLFAGHETKTVAAFAALLAKAAAGDGTADAPRRIAR